MKWAKNIYLFPLVFITACQHTRGKGCHPKEPGQTDEVDFCEPCEAQQGQVQGPGITGGQQRLGGEWIESSPEHKDLVAQQA